MVVVPDTDIILVKSPLKLDNNNQITFANATAQYNYFASLPKLSYKNCTYQRKDGVIRYDTNNNLTYEDLLQYNYCMYKNKSYKNKWFYAFITDITYINDGMSEVKIDTDVFQTWQFDIIYMNSFIEREHVNDDTIGRHTIPEGLEHGGYIIANANRVTAKLSYCYIVVAVTWVPPNTPQFGNENTLYNNIYSGSMLLAFRNADDCTRFIKIYDKMDRADAINNIYMVPAMAINGLEVVTFDRYTSDGITTEFAVVPYSTGIAVVEQNLTYSNVSSLNGYTPRNNKLFTYPYCYFSVSNNAGKQVEFRYEDFIGNTPTFDIACGVNAGAQSAMIPKSYKLKSDILGYDIFYTYGITGGKYPTCSWKTDPYINWLTEQAVNHQMAGLNFGLNTLSYASRGDVLGGVQSTVSQIGGMMNEYYQHALQSPTLEGQPSNGDFCYSWGNNGFTYYKMCIRYEYARKIDKYFTMYGYKINELKNVNIFTRSNWNFIKCVNVNLEGNIPEADLDSIRELFNNGCTFWHTTANFLDYSQANTIV